MSRRPDWMKRREVKGKNGKARVVFEFDDYVEGERQRKRLGEDFEEARRMGLAFLEEITQRSKPGDLTVAEFGRQWLELYVKQRRKKNPKGYSLALQRFEDYVEPGLGHFGLSEVGSGELTEFARGLRSTKTGRVLSDQTVKHILADVRCILNVAQRWKELAVVPSFKDAIPDVDEKAPNPLSEAQLTAIYDDLASYPYQLFHVRLARWTGARFSEVHRLRWRDVKWGTEPSITIAKSKSGKVRWIALFPQVVEILQGEQSRQTEALRRPVHGDEFVSPYRLKDASNICGRSTKRLEWHWHFHQLRDTFACWFLNSGGRLEELQPLLGHSSIAMTQKYGKLSNRAVFDAVERISRATGQSTGQRVVSMEGKVAESK